jgi:hypothetical protein
MGKCRVTFNDNAIQIMTIDGSYASTGAGANEPSISPACCWYTACDLENFKRCWHHDRFLGIDALLKFKQSRPHARLPTMYCVTFWTSRAL